MQPLYTDGSGTTVRDERTHAVVCTFTPEHRALASRLTHADKIVAAAARLLKSIAAGPTGETPGHAADLVAQIESSGVMLEDAAHAAVERLAHLADLSPEPADASPGLTFAEMTKPTEATKPTKPAKSKGKGR